MLVLGVDAPGAGHAALHDMMATREYYDALPASVREHLVCRVVEMFVPVTQKHDIEGLVMGWNEGRSASNGSVGWPLSSILGRLQPGQTFPEADT